MIRCHEKMPGGSRPFTLFLLEANDVKDRSQSNCFKETLDLFSNVTDDGWDRKRADVLAEGAFLKSYTGLWLKDEQQLLSNHSTAGGRQEVGEIAPIFCSPTFLPTGKSTWR